MKGFCQSPSCYDIHQGTLFPKCVSHLAISLINLLGFFFISIIASGFYMHIYLLNNILNTFLLTATLMSETFMGKHSVAHLNMYISDELNISHTFKLLAVLLVVLTKADSLWSQPKYYSCQF